MFDKLKLFATFTLALALPMLLGGSASAMLPEFGCSAVYMNSNNEICTADVEQTSGEGWSMITECEGGGQSYSEDNGYVDMYTWYNILDESTGGTVSCNYH